MRNWADLPEELLSLILSNLFAKDRHTFNLVCRSWNAASAASPYRHSHCLMFYQTSEHLWKFFQYNNFFYMDIPELDNAEILCSKYGWLLISRDDYTLFFFDPFNKQKIELPTTSDYSYNTITFFHPPTSPDCIIVGIAAKTWCEDVQIGVLKHGEVDWQSYTYRSKFLVSLGAPVLHCGLLYFLDVKGNVATFNISGQGHESCWDVNTRCLTPRRLRNNIKQHFLFKVKGEEALFAVFVGHDERKVNVYRLLEPEMQWELVEDLGDKVLYLSHTSCFGYTARSKSMANKIYFPRFHGNSAVFYSLHTRRYHSFEGNYSSNNSSGLKRLDFATWITPAPTPELPRELTWCPKLDGIRT
ncbi:hypothetical protein Pfo_021336 [Paulownia fortunei]|nr:hypothetical protein Pfo_021336 [Paulownia fortunei]